LGKLIIVFIYVWMTCFSQLAWTVPREQDRAILEGTETNLLTNPGFEARKSAWTASGSSVFSIETASPIKGKFSAKWDPSTTGEFFDSKLILIESGFVGDRCQMEFKYRWTSGVTGEIKAVLRQRDDSEATESDVASVDLTPTSGNLNSIIQLPIIDCPDDPADSYKFRLESTANAAEITVDRAFMGVGRNTFQLSSSSLAAHAFYGTTTDCIWAVTSVTFADFPTDSDCPAITVTSSTTTVDTTDNNLPDFVLPNLLPGRYFITSIITGHADTGANTFGFKLIDETDSIFMDCGINQTDPNSTYRTVCETSFVLTQKTNKTFRIQGFAASGAAAIRNALSGRQLSFTLLKFPINDVAAITLETVGEHWDVNIGGANINLGVVDVDPYEELTDAGLDMVINTDKGSKSAEIPCSGANPSTGLTCSSGEESLGIVIDILTAGRYEACFYFTHSSAADAAGFIQTTFQIVETPNDDATTISQEGHTRMASSGDNSTAVAISGHNPMTVCSNFIFNSVGRKTLRLFYEQDATATVSNNFVIADRLSTKGQRDIHITVENKDQQKPTPILTDLTNSLIQKVEYIAGATNQVTARAKLFCSGSSSITSNTGGWISTIGNISTGICVITYNSGKFSGDPDCLVGTVSTPPLIINISASPSSGSMSTRCQSNAGNDCGSYSIEVVCKGDKP